MIGLLLISNTEKKLALPGTAADEISRTLLTNRKPEKIGQIHSINVIIQSTIVSH
jgi:hypothetical protein